MEPSPAASPRCSRHDLLLSGGHCPLRSCRGAGRRWCPRHGTALVEGRCECGFVDAEIPRLYHWAPRSARAAILADGLSPQAVAECWGPSAGGQPAGVYAFADVVTAESERAFIESVKGECDLWAVSMADVHEMHEDRGYATESVIVTHRVAAALVPTIASDTV